jgi:hypothetical protein
MAVNDDCSQLNKQWRLSMSINKKLFIGVITFIVAWQSQAAGNVTCWPDVIPPTDQKALLNWLNKGSYKSNFLAEAKIHPSTIHGNAVRVYHNPILAADLHAKRKVFRKGAATIKELYTNGKVTGYAVSIKTQQHKQSLATDWLFYETFNKSGQNAIFGRGIDECASCHQQGGTDYLRSNFRPYK